MLHCSTSLWSADLANLENEIKRVEPYSGRFHIDVADGHYSETLLFFPDLVKQMRPHTNRPFEVHLMTTDPEFWLDSFVEAGSNVIIFFLDSVNDPGKMIDAIHAKGNQAAHDACQTGYRATEYWPVDESQRHHRSIRRQDQEGVCHDDGACGNPQPGSRALNPVHAILERRGDLGHLSQEYVQDKRDRQGKRRND